MSTTISDDVRATVLEALTKEGRLEDGVTALRDDTQINAGEFSIDSLAFIRAFILLEDDLGVEFGDDALMHNKFAKVSDVLDYVAGELAKQGGR